MRVFIINRDQVTPLVMKRQCQKAASLCHSLSDSGDIDYSPISSPDLETALVNELMSPLSPQRFFGSIKVPFCFEDEGDGFLLSSGARDTSHVVDLFRKENADKALFCRNILSYQSGEVVSKNATVFRVHLCPLVTSFTFSVTEKGLDCSSILFDQEYNTTYRGAISIEYFRDTDFHIPSDTNGTVQLTTLTWYEATLTIIHPSGYGPD